MFKFRRMRAMDPLQVAMTGIRMGEKYLQIFCSDVTLTRGLAAKAGLSGEAALLAADEPQAARARGAAAKEGVLIDLKVASPGTLDWPDAAFDMIVVDNTGDSYSALADNARAVLLESARRVLRAGGRIELVERIGGGLFGGSSQPPEAYAKAGGAEGTFRAAGFKPVRMLAEKDGYRFVEGLKG